MKMPRLAIDNKTHIFGKVVDGKFVFYVNKEGVRYFLWGFWLLATSAPIHEEISFSFNCEELQSFKNQEFKYCEILLIAEAEALLERQVRPRRYALDAINHRVDITMTRREAHQAFAALTKIDKAHNKKRLHVKKMMESIWIEYWPELN